MTALCVAFWATFLLVLVDHVLKQCFLYAVGCLIRLLFTSCALSLVIDCGNKSNPYRDICFRVVHSTSKGFSDSFIPRAQPKRTKMDLTGFLNSLFSCLDAIFDFVEAVLRIVW
jgi:hypothetical protein